jgi:hypothetical protein
MTIVKKSIDIATGETSHRRRGTRASRRTMRPINQARARITPGASPGDSGSESRLPPLPPKRNEALSLVALRKLR